MVDGSGPGVMYGRASGAPIHSTLTSRRLVVLVALQYN